MRYSQSVLRALTAAALAAPLVAGSIVGSVSPAAAAVYTPQQALPAPTIQQFLANPSGLLTSVSQWWAGSGEDGPRSRRF